MYPLNADYKTPIIAFVKRLRTYADVKVETNGVSTQLYGEYDVVMEMIQKEFKTVFGGDDKVSMVMKVINDDLSGSVKF